MPVLELLNNGGWEPIRNMVVVPAPPGYIGWRNRFLVIDFWDP
jgi:hypothetical protein